MRLPPARSLTLRTRLTLTVFLLAGAAILIIGVVTYQTLESYLMGRVDEQLRVARMTAGVAVRAGIEIPSLPGPARPAGDALLPPGTYAELRRDGEIVNSVTFRYGLKKPAPPELDAVDVRASVASGKPFTAGAESGSLRYRVLASRVSGLTGYSVVVAVPLTEVDATLGHVLWIEIALGAGVLLVLVVAAWLLVRRELRPLDAMAVAAGEIAGGDLTRRVAPAEPHTEVGRLGLALNAMLAQIERAFAAREASERRLRRFLADASHELRTPLTSIRGYAELFRRGADARPDDLAVSMRRIEEEARRMGVLVDDLLLLARLDDQRPLLSDPVDLAALVADGVRDARAATPGRQITLTLPAAGAGTAAITGARAAEAPASPEVTRKPTTPTAGPAEEPAGAAAAGRSASPAAEPEEPEQFAIGVTGDDHRLRQVVANLLSNALRHTPAGTAIEVDLAVRDQRALLRVVDHGPGLTAEQAEHVFEPFYRSDAARDRAVGGAGLGLAIAKAIVDAHGGELTLESTPGGGATFVARLPLTSAASTDR